MITREHFIAALYALSKRCDYEMTDWEIQIYEEELAPLGWDKVLVVMRELFVGVKAGHKWSMPSVLDIKEKMGAAPVSIDLQAAEAASRAFGALTRFGDIRIASKVKECREYVGDIAWEAVRQLFGNWGEFCKQVTYDNRGTMEAQLRQTAAVIAEKAKRGILPDQPLLPETPGARNVQAAIASAFSNVKVLSDKPLRDGEKKCT